MSKNSDFVSAMQAQMRQFDKDVDALGTGVGAKSRASYLAQVKHLRESREAGQNTLLLLRAASESADARMHAGMQAALHTMQASLKRISADLGK